MARFTSPIESTALFALNKASTRLKVSGRLARYTHRVAITNHRLVAFRNHQVTFRWKDYAHGNHKRMVTLEASEFLRRFLLHVLPRGFVRIRSFGFLANLRRPFRPQRSGSLAIRNYDFSSIDLGFIISELLKPTTNCTDHLS